MNDREDIDGLAAEYVLGTLDAAERAEVAARRQREDDLDMAIGLGSGGWRRWPKPFPRSGRRPDCSRTSRRGWPMRRAPSLERGK